MFTNFAISTHFVFAMMVSLSPKIRWLNGWSLGIIGWSDWFRISQNPKKMMFYDVMWCYLLQKKHKICAWFEQKKRPIERGAAVCWIWLPYLQPLDDPKFNHDFNGGNVISASMRIWLCIPIPGWLNMVKHGEKWLNMIKPCESPVW